MARPEIGRILNDVPSIAAHLRSKNMPDYARIIEILADELHRRRSIVKTVIDWVRADTVQKKHKPTEKLHRLVEEYCLAETKQSFGHPGTYINQKSKRSRPV